MTNSSAGGNGGCWLISSFTELSAELRCWAHCLRTHVSGVPRGEPSLLLTPLALETFPFYPFLSSSILHPLLLGISFLKLIVASIHVGVHSRSGAMVSLINGCQVSLLTPALGWVTWSQQTLLVLHLQIRDLMGGLCRLGVGDLAGR